MTATCPHAWLFRRRYLYRVTGNSPQANTGYFRGRAPESPVPQVPISRHRDSPQADTGYFRGRAPKRPYRRYLYRVRGFAAGKYGVL